MDEETSARLAAIRKELRQFQREERDKKLRAGKVRPKTYKEMDIFAADLLNPPPLTPRQRKTGGLRSPKRTVEGEGDDQ